MAATAFALPGLAQADPAVDARIAALEAQVEALSAALIELKKEAAERPTPPAPASAVIQLPTPSAAPARTEPEATVSIAGGRPTISSSDGAFTASIRAVFQLDAAHYDQRAPGPLGADFRRGSVGDAGEAGRARDLADGANFRRARLGIEGKAFGDFDYNFVYDFGGSGAEEPGKIISAWAQYSGLGKAKLRIGAFSPPAGIDEASSTNGLLFLERASPTETIRSLASGDSRVAAGVLANGERWNASAVVSGGVVGASTYDEQLGFVGRLAFTPLKQKDAVIHVGANTSIVINPAATGPDIGGTAPTPIRLRDRPEIRVDGTRLIDTGSIDADRVVAIGGELAAQYRNLYAQAEYFDVSVDRKGPLSNPQFSGWYVQGAWTLTGEPRRYSASSASFDAPRPAKPFDPKTGQWGAWELGLRYSNLNLNHHAGAPGTAQLADAIRGGEQEIFTVGLNWYLNDVLRFQAAVQDVSVDRLSAGGATFGAGATPPAGSQIGQDFQVYSVRTQYAF